MGSFVSNLLKEEWGADRHRRALHKDVVEACLKVRCSNRHRLITVSLARVVVWWAGEIGRQFNHVSV